MRRVTPKTFQQRVLGNVEPNVQHRLAREAALLLQLLELGRREEADGLLHPISVLVERLCKKSAKPADGQAAEAHVGA